ncbi:agmatine deiminase family protein [Streptomyces sp. NPDC002032]|uniref:agmatine deiminase family protein n=1 Tax=Streptomyces sp. NPDC002032 TaxID=3364630 RepID=UPI0036BC2F6E
MSSRPAAAERFPERDVVPVAIDTMASGGGGMHCSTHDQPAGLSLSPRTDARREDQSARRWSALPALMSRISWRSDSVESVR